MNCPLCHNGDAIPLTQPQTPAYFHCEICDLRFLDPASRLKADQELERYYFHNNDHKESGYRTFLKPLIDSALKNSPPPKSALDYGAGELAPVAELLREHGYSAEVFDPYFFPEHTVLTKKYDLITACEVVEHFYHPGEEFGRLRKLLKAGGALAMMTLIYQPEIDFKEWHYRRDPTHVVFYSEKTFQWITKNFGFRDYEIYAPRVAVLKA